MAFLTVASRGSPGSPHEMREECFEIIDGMVRDGIAPPDELWVVEHDERGRVVGEPFGAPSGLEFAKRPRPEPAPARRMSSVADFVLQESMHADWVSRQATAGTGGEAQ